MPRPAPSFFTVAREIVEPALLTLPQCEECGAEDDNLDRGICRECEDYSAPSAADLYRSERTW